jgi:hypothetical protein
VIELGHRLIEAPRRWLVSTEDWLLAEPRAIHGAALCRIGTALSVLGLLVANFSSRDVWVGQGSIWAQPVRELRQFPELALLDGVSGDILTAFYVVTIGAALAMALGWHAKAANVVTLVGFIAIVAQNPVVGDEGDNLLRITLLWLLLMQTADFWSLDARRRERRVAATDGSVSAMRQAWDGERVFPSWLSAGLHHVGLIGLMTQTILLFTAGGLDKISQDVWQRGTALYYTMQLPEFRPYPSLSDAVTNRSLVLAALTYLVLLTQLFFGPLLLHPLTRRIVLFLTITVNLVLAVLLALPWSSLAFIALAGLFVSGETYERFDEWLRATLAPVGDWLVLRWYDVQDLGAAVLDRTLWAAVDRVRAGVSRR